MSLGPVPTPKVLTDNLLTSVGVSTIITSYADALGSVRLVNLTVDDVSPLIVYDPPGAWNLTVGQRNTDLYNDTSHATNTYNASLFFSFYGTAVYYYGNGGSDHGPATVFLDDQIVATPSSFYQNGEPVLLWGAANLSLETQHQVVVSCLNQVYPNVVQLDAFQITTDPRIIQPGQGGVVSSLGAPISYTGSSSSSGGTNAGAIAGGVVGGLVVLLAIAAAIWAVCRRRRRKDADECVGRPYSRYCGSFEPKIHPVEPALIQDRPYSALPPRLAPLDVRATTPLLNRAGGPQSASASPVSTASDMTLGPRSGYAQGTVSPFPFSSSFVSTRQSGTMLSAPLSLASGSIVGDPRLARALAEEERDPKARLLAETEGESNFVALSPSSRVPVKDDSAAPITPRPAPLPEASSPLSPVEAPRLRRALSLPTSGRPEIDPAPRPAATDVAPPPYII